MPRAPRLPLNTLPAFRAVAESQNLRAAADALHLTHSAVSQQLRGMEEQLGFQLFERRGRRVVLNAAGEALLRSVSAALATLDAGVQAAAAASSDTRQRLRISVLPSFAQRWLLPRMNRWRERYPTLRSRSTRRSTSSTSSARASTPRCDKGAVRGPAWTSELLFGEPMPMIVVGSPDAARRLAGAPPEALAREPLLGYADLWERWFAEAGVPTRVTTVATFNDAGPDAAGRRAESRPGDLARAPRGRRAPRRPARQAVAARHDVRARVPVSRRLSAGAARLAAALRTAAVAAGRARAVARIAPSRRAPEERQARAPTRGAVGRKRELR